MIIKFLTNLLFRILFRVKVRGEFQLHDRLLIVCNHTSFIDGIILGAFLPVWPTYLVHTTIARLWYFRIGLRFLSHLVVDSTSPLAIKSVIGLLETGAPVVIFPEGRITITGSIMKVYDGPAFVVAKTGATVVPVHIDGAEFSYFSRMTGDFPKRLFPRITVTIGPPATIPMPDAPSAKLRRRMASEQMRRIMQNAAYTSRKSQTLFEAFLDAMSIYGRSRVILKDVRPQIDTYGSLLKASMALGRLVSKFSAEREIVGLLMPNVGTTVSLMFGMFAMRRVPAMLNYTAGLDGMQSACRTAQIKLVITSRVFLEKAKLTATVEKLQDVRVLYLEDLRSHFTVADKIWLLCRAVWFPRGCMRPARPGDPAIVLFTSGSEGRPKGVVLSHDCLLANAAQVRSVIEFNSKDKFLTALPLFHAFGLTGGIIVPFMKGSYVFLYPSPLHYRVVPEVVYDQDCTVLFSTNTFLGHYAKAAHPYDFNRLKYLLVGAEKLTADVRSLCFEKFGIRVLEGYGATECAPVISLNTPLAQRSGTVGELLPGMEARVAPVAGIEHGGELHLRGANVMLGYLKHDQPGVIQPPSSEFGEGWYDTGDIVSLDGTQFITIQGRIKRFAKVAGEMVSLETVEKLATSAQPKYPHAAVALKDQARGELILLFTQDPALRREQIQATAREMGAPEIAIPRRILHVDKLPLLGNGKRDYVTLGKMAEELTATAVRSS